MTTPLDPTHIPAGTLTLSFFDNGEGQLYPVVTASPIGRITPGTLDKHLALIFRKVQELSITSRNMTVIDTPPAEARRRRR